MPPSRPLLPVSSAAEQPSGGTSSGAGFALAAVVAVFSLAGIGWLILSSIINIRGVEPNVVYTLSEMRAGGSLYTDPSQPPFTLTQYSPLYYLLVNLFASAFELAPGDATGLIRCARLVSAATFGLLLASVYLLLRRALQATPAVCAGAVLLIGLATSPWYFLARPDVLVALLSLGCLTCLVMLETTRLSAMPLLAIACLLAVASVFAKQNGLATVISLGAYLLHRRAWTHLSSAVLVVSLLLAAGALVSLSVWGSPFLHNVVLGVQNGIDFGNFVNKVVWGFFPLYLPLVAAIGITAVDVLWKGNAVPGERPVFVFAIVWFALSTVAALKRGAAENYFNEFLLFGIVGVFGTWRRKSANHGALLHRTAAAWFLMLVPLMLWNNIFGYLVRASRGSFPAVDPCYSYDTRREAAILVRSLLDDEGGLAASSDYGMVGLLAPRTIEPHSEITIPLMRDGMVSAIEKKRLVTTDTVRYVVTADGACGGDLWPESLSATRDDYCPFYMVDGFKVYALCAKPNAR